MKGLPFVLFFTAMTFVAWGAYGPVLHHGAIGFKGDSMRAFVGVGLAYFLIAVLIPMAILKTSGEKGAWSLSGSIYSLIAGGVGAIGALGIILALGYGGQTVYVMPLVFGFAPVVNTLVTAFLSKTFSQISPIFIIGIITAALGAGGVLVFKPTAPPSPKIAMVNQENQDVDNQQASTEHSPVAETLVSETLVSEAPVDERTEDKPTTGSTAHSKSSEATLLEIQASTAGTKKPVNVAGVIFSIIIATLCWGSYGPMLHIGQGKMSGSRLRPFTCVGLAYFFIAVAAPLILIYAGGNDKGTWTGAGMTWSFLAGVAGAIGALGVLLAFNSGGKPYYVMPLIFGFAPVINTFISLSEAGTWSLVQPMFWVSLAVVIAGAITVLTNAPKPVQKHKPIAAS